MSTRPTHRPAAQAATRTAAGARGAAKSAKSIPARAAKAQSKKVSNGSAPTKKPAAGGAKAAATRGRSAVQPASPAPEADPAGVVAKANGGARPNGADAAAAAAEPKPHKAKLVRDSFTMPKPEYQVIDQLKQRSAALARPAKKSELLRAGLKALAVMDDAAFAAAIHAVPAIKTGRPKSKKAADHTPLE